MTSLSSEFQSRILIPNSISMTSLLGTNDENLKIIEKQFSNLNLHVRGNEINISGPTQDVKTLNQLFSEMISLLRTGQSLNAEVVERSISMIRDENQENPSQVLTVDILTSRGKAIRPKTFNQKKYVEAIDNHTVVFGIGPAGSGKTYLAVAKAVQALQAKQVNRIVLTRPAVEAGEHLGFLPGTLSEKIDPYLRPLYDALQDMIEPEKIPKLMTNGSIEVAPLAYMRGRTLNDSFIILDEAQNTSPEQMKMFLTRLDRKSTRLNSSH